MHAYMIKRLLDLVDHGLLWLDSDFLRIVHVLVAQFHDAEIEGRGEQHTLPFVKRSGVSKDVTQVDDEAHELDGQNDLFGDALDRQRASHLEVALADLLDGAALCAAVADGSFGSIAEASASFVSG